MTQETKHTPERWDWRGPWKIMYDKSIQDAYGEEVLTVLHEYQHSAWDESAAARIVACVNACAGMADPAAEIAALRAESESNYLLRMDIEEKENLIVEYHTEVESLKQRIAELEKEADNANG